MFAFTGGELAMTLFILALVYGAGVLPKLGERIAERLGARAREGSPRAPLDRR
ncbi:MAG: hypothetical protein JOZ69_13780 [Myxococcales bacterium]|nr:hypothetical protein [Myxococcales bacterium]